MLPRMNAVRHIAIACARDCSRRGSLILLLLVGVALTLALRWLCAFALGEELSLLEELGLSNLALGGALAAILCAAPVNRASAVAAADRALTTRAIGPLTLPFARWLGGSLILAGMTAVWLLALGIALAWFAADEPTLFSMSRETTVAREIPILISGALVVLFQSIMLAGLAVAAAARGGMVAAALAVLGVLVAGVLLPDAAAAKDAPVLLKALAFALPDLRLHFPAENLAGEAMIAGRLSGCALQALGYGVAAILCSGSLYARERT